LGSDIAWAAGIEVPLSPMARLVTHVDGFKLRKT
jgi:hypothetical protein